MSSWALAAAAGIVISYAGLSRRLEGTPVSAPIFFLSAGLLLGSEGFGWIGLSSTGEQVRVLAELTLTLVLFADASRIDLSALRREYTVPARLLGIGLPLTILAGWALGVAMFGSLNWAEVLILAVILAPTDAALGQAVVTDPRLPSRIRQGLNVESGLNDGICVPLLFIGLALAEAETGSASNHAALALVVEAIGYGVLFGAIAGVIGALVVKLARRHGLMDSAWGQILPAATAALAYGLAAPLGGSGFIAAFVAGFVFGALQRDTMGEATYLLDQLGELTNGVTFIVFGAAIVGPVLSDLTWRAALYGVLSLTVVRMLPVADFAARDARQAADLGVRRLVRSARARLDRFHDHRARGRRLATRLDDHGRRGLHDRPFRLRPWAFGAAVDGSLRKLVPGAPEGSPAQHGKRPRVSPPLAAPPDC